MFEILIYCKKKFFPSYRSSVGSKLYFFNKMCIKLLQNCLTIEIMETAVHEENKKSTGQFFDIARSAMFFVLPFSEPIEIIRDIAQ